MQMTESEILRDYNLSKDQRAQLTVLADLNCTTARKIAEILIKQGVDINTLPAKYRPKKEEPKVADILSMLIEALEAYKKATTNALEEEIDKAESTFMKIEAALAYVKEQV